jgi:Arc/MetJ-type ribon-helix-helix transcriptional regulator
MKIVLPPELDQLVKRQIERGPYKTTLEVLLAGVHLLEHQAQPGPGEVYGELDENLNFVPRTEAEMVQQSLEILARYQGDAVSQDQVDAWASSLGTDSGSTAPAVH